MCNFGYHQPRILRVLVNLGGKPPNLAVNQRNSDVEDIKSLSCSHLKSSRSTTQFNVQSAHNVCAVPADQATNLLLAFKARGMSEASAATAAAEGIARSAARQLLGPLLAAACARVAVVLRQTFVVALERTAAALQGEVHVIWHLQLVTWCRLPANESPCAVKCLLTL